MEQTILKASSQYVELNHYFKKNNIHSFLLVCDKALSQLAINKYFIDLEWQGKIRIIKFNRFHSNPEYESVVEGVCVFKANQCDSIVAVGGGSAIDVAKCIKLYSNMDSDGAEGAFLKQEIVPNSIKFLAIPTTAGTGSEATKYAVIYYKDEKQSVTHESCIPDTVLMDSTTLLTLPLYQKKSTMMDALCHDIESFWSVNSTDQSKKYSKKSIKIILNNMQGYLINDHISNENMLLASYIAGKAINITQTTAGHALCYKLTSLYGIAHGHAAALCISQLWPWMLQNLDKCVDPRGNLYLKTLFEELADIMGCKSAEYAPEKFKNILNELKLTFPDVPEKNYGVLCKSVNEIRLRNNPVTLNRNDIDTLYHRILEGRKNES